jgi:predicted ATPase/DNA-binding winged helix-turn-helix (wHTH) protein
MTPGKDQPHDIGDVVHFGPFSLLPLQRVLLSGDNVVPLGSRALDILCLLVERSGELVSKGEIVERVWPGTYVVDGNLRVHMAGLRKALRDGREGQRYIVTVPNRGYGFVAPLERKTAAAVTVSSLCPFTAVSPALPAPLYRVVGRAQALQTLTENVAQHRLVTVVGAGGIGKTTLATTVATTLAGRTGLMSGGGVYFVDLAAIGGPGEIACALAAALGLSVTVESALPCLLTFLRDKQLLILLDNCEHVVEAAAVMVETLLRSAPTVRILATSREPLRAEGEWVQHLQPLEIPVTSPASVDQAMRYPAVELFVERAMACSGTFVLRDGDVDAIVDICRRLDGVPLALELAAARVDSLSPNELMEALDDGLAILTKGRRTALRRHRSLRAALDWSFDLLPERDAVVLRRLSIFAGAFTSDAASKVLAFGCLTSADIVDGVAELVARSMITADVGRNETSFRLLNTTRAYAMEKLRLSHDSALLARRYAEHCRSEAVGDSPIPLQHRALRKY